MNASPYAAIAALVLFTASAWAQQAVEWDGASWRVEDIRGRGVIDNAQTTLRIDADGAVSGSTGCNRYSGKATVDAKGLRFGPLATTFRACPPAIADQEQKFLAALEETRAARFDPVGRLQLVSAKGEALLTLTKM
jgi:putative lipoprotein